MYLMVGAILELIGICNQTVWSVGVPTIIKERQSVLGLSLRKVSYEALVFSVFSRNHWQE